MTDGQNNAGKIAPLTAAEAAKALKVKVYTIGVGMRGMAPMPVYDRFHRKIGTRPEPVDIDEDTLQSIARMTGGKYYRADNTQKFQAIYAEIDQLEKTEADIKKYAHHEELFAWMITPGLGLLAPGDAVAPYAFAEAAMKRSPIVEGRGRKVEIRNPKSEIRRKSEIRNPKAEIACLSESAPRSMPRPQAIPCHAPTAPNEGPGVNPGLRVPSDFGFRISFGFRFSVFGFSSALCP